VLLIFVGAVFFLSFFINDITKELNKLNKNLVNLFIAVDGKTILDLLTRVGQLEDIVRDIGEEEE